MRSQKMDVEGFSPPERRVKCFEQQLWTSELGN